MPNQCLFIKVWTTYVHDTVLGTDEKLSNKTKIILSIKGNYSSVRYYEYNLVFDDYDIEGQGTLSTYERDESAQQKRFKNPLASFNYVNFQTFKSVLKPQSQQTKGNQRSSLVKTEMNYAFWSVSREMCLEYLSPKWVTKVIHSQVR